MKQSNLKPFQFKKFSVSHSHSSMRIGVDAVNLGCWVSLEGCGRIIDIGTGCGVIALICAQRNEDAMIDAIDIDKASVSEASENFRMSPWHARLECRVADFSELTENKNTPKYDLVISNPPYFDAGVYSRDSARLRARHEGTLSPEAIIRSGQRILAPDGRIAIIFPGDRYDEIADVAVSSGMDIIRAIYVRGHRGAEIKRVMVELRKTKGNPRYIAVPDIITLEETPGTATDEYKSLCRDFYLRF